MRDFTRRNCVSQLRNKSGAFVRSLLTDLDGRNSRPLISLGATASDCCCSESGHSSSQLCPRRLGESCMPALSVEGLRCLVSLCSEQTTRGPCRCVFRPCRRPQNANCSTQTVQTLTERTL